MTTRQRSPSLEREPLLETGISTHIPNAVDGVALTADDSNTAESYDPVPQDKRQLGLFSAVLLIFNRIIGTGIYATPSIILRGSGSIGVAFVIWSIGACIAAVGTAVYVELGTGLPRSGGEKNYLEFIYRRPKFLMTCCFVAYALITGTASANSVVFGEYVLNALGYSPSRWNTRFIAFLCLTFNFLIHGTALKFGLRLQNTLGVLKLVILSTIVICGLLSLVGVEAFQVRSDYETPDNFHWGSFWEGSSNDANAIVTALYNVVWSFVGYSNANYALSEIKDPVRTIKRAAPIALISVTTMYMLINVAYFAVVSKTDILSSRRIVAALFFRNLFGPTFERTLSALIALSLLGNLLAGMFTQGRVIQELGREGILPYSSFFSSNKPFNAPLAGMFTQYLVSCAFMLAPPPGDAYLFMISLSSYCLALINMSVSLGLLLLYLPSYREWNWHPPFHAAKTAVVLFFLSNVFLVVVPLIPPAPGSKSYAHLPYWSHVVVAVGVSAIGVLYWYFWSIWFPRKRGYTLEREWVVQEDGVSRCVFVKIPK